jgi:hypothetical protein
MKNVVLCLSLLTASACSKKTENAPAPATETAPAAAPGAETPSPTEAQPGAAKAAPFEKTGIAECDAVLDSYSAFQGCAAIKEEDRVVQDLSVEQLKGIVTLPPPADPDQKEMMQKATVTQCKETDTKLKELLEAAGC